MLTHQNYYSWAPRAKAILKKEKQWKWIDPSKKDDNLKLSGDKWVEFEDAKKDYLGLFITDEVIQDVKDLTHAYEVWTFLEKRRTRS